VANENALIGQNQLNVVLEPIKMKKFVSMKSGTRRVPWLFVFFFNENVSESDLVASIENYFKSYEKITLNSQIYILVSAKDMVLMFEVFRKIQDLYVTVSHLCSLNQTSDTIEYLNKNNVLVRRKDLTGIHFRVGYIPNESFFYEDNKASSILI
jgi:hypothetical protein